jgi:hypothetical protein
LTARLLPLIYSTAAGVDSIPQHGSQ